MNTSADFALTVDYSQSLEELVVLGKYDRTVYNVNDKNFPTERSGKANLQANLIHFDRTISSEDAVKEMSKEGYRPAELNELLVFGITHPELQRKLRIIALGSEWREGDNFRCITYLYSFSGCAGRELVIDIFGRKWDRFCRFLAVCK